MSESNWQYRPAADIGLSQADRMRSMAREPGLVSRVTHSGCTRLLHVYFLLYHRLRMEGTENLPLGPPFVLIANHCSHLDALVLASALPKWARHCTFPVAAGDVFFTSPRRSLASTMFLNALPLWRRKTVAHALKDLRIRLERGDCGLILFPEGTRSRDGKMNSFKPGLGMLVAGTDVPIVPCHITGAFEALRPDSMIPRPVRLIVRIGRSLRFAEIGNDREGWMHVAAAAEQAVRSLEKR